MAFFRPMPWWECDWNPQSYWNWMGYLGSRRISIFCCFWQPDSLTVLSGYTLQTLVSFCWLYPLIIQNCWWLYPQASNCLVADLKVSGKCSLKASLGPFYVDYVDGLERILDWLKICIRFSSPENTYWRVSLKNLKTRRSTSYLLVLSREWGNDP